MAIIGKIREKSWLILIIVGGALAAFILGDYNKGAGAVESKYGYGTVYGEKVNIDDFLADVKLANDNSELNAQQSGQPKQPVDETAVWNNFVENLVLEQEYQALGIDVSASEFDAYLYGREGFAVLPELAQGFTDSLTGMFNEKLLQSRIEEMESSDDARIQKQWTDSKKYYTEKRKQEKYFAILSQGMYVTDLEAKNEYFAQKEEKNIAYVLKRFIEISDDKIPVTDKKLRAYFEEHKSEKRYANRVASRDVKFFDIAIQPSKQDSNTFETTMTELKKTFAATSKDSAFVMANSENKYFVRQIGYRPEGDPAAKQGFTYPKSLDTLFKSASKGTVVGPYEENGSTKIAKVIDVQTKLLAVRHILISAPRADTLAVEKAKRKTDSLMQHVNSDNFAEMVTKHTEDPGSKDTGGKYENFVDGEMVPEFSTYAMNEPIGKIGYVQTDFGFHIMEVLSRTEGRIPNLVIVQKTLKPSQESIDDQESKISELIYKLDEKLSEADSEYEKVVLFDTIASQEGYMVRSMNLIENSPKVYGFTSKFGEDKILKLAFREDAMVGDLVDAPIKDKDRYVIAVLSSIKEKGEPKFEEVELVIKRDYIEEEKTKRITKEMTGASSLEALSKKLNGAPVTKATVTFANPQITGSTFEPEVVGAIFSGLKDGERTKPIKGKAGVYVIRLEKTVKPPVAANYLMEKNQLLSGQKGNIQGTAKKALVKLADVVDNRRLFEAGIRR